MVQNDKQESSEAVQRRLAMEQKPFAGELGPFQLGEYCEQFSFKISSFCEKPELFVPASQKPYQNFGKF
jgi:hypothetical protein